MPRRTFRIRNLQILVAIAALASAGEVTRRRRAGYRAIAAYDAERERLHREDVAFHEGQSEKFRRMAQDDPSWEPQIGIEARSAQTYSEKEAYHARLRREYERRW